MNSFKIYSSLAEIYGSFEGILLDAYGVFWGGGEVGLLPHSKELMEQMVRAGKKVGILSNSTQLVENELKKLQKHGLEKGTHFHFLMTSGQVAKDLFQVGSFPFKTTNKKFWLFGTPSPKYASHQMLFDGSSFQETAQIEEADFIYISVPHIQGEDQIDPGCFLEEVKKLKGRSIPMVCVNPDKFAHEGKPPRPVMRQGSIATFYEELGGKVFYVGKPSSLMYEAAMREFSHHHLFDASKIVMVGDTPETDIRGAKRFGMASALITQTGIMADRIAKMSLGNALQNLSSSDTPDFYLERLHNGI